ncbi:MAG: sigma-70 family RNA polymerase sigma factor [Paracoccaceae bacterium]
MHALMPANDTAAVAAETPEAVLLLRAGAGDRQAFDELAQRTARPSLALALRVLGDSARAEDAVQDALTKLWLSAARFEPARGSFSAWWRRILMNCTLDARRRLRPVTPLDDIAETADPAPDPLADAETTDLAAQVQLAMAQLPARQRAAMTLFYSEDLSMKEIADALDSTPKAIEGLLLRGRTALRDSLAYLKDEIT